MKKSSTNDHDLNFTIGARPDVTYFHRGKQRSRHVQAVLDTFKSGKALTFETEADCDRAYTSTISAIRRLYPEQRVRRFKLTLWVEAKPAAEPKRKAAK